MNCVQLFIPDFKHTICSYILCSQFQTYYSAKLQGKFITGLIRGLVVSIMQKKIEVGEKVCSVFFYTKSYILLFNTSGNYLLVLRNTSRVPRTG